MPLQAETRQQGGNMKSHNENDLPLPEWAERHHYRWHSNPRSRTRSKALFDKCIIRPKLKQSWEIVRSDWAAQDDIDEAWSVIRRLESDFNQSANSNMVCGRLAQTAADKVLFANGDVNEAIDWALEEFSKYVPRTWDNGTDEMKADQYQTELPNVISNAVEGLREAMMEDPNRVDERKLMGFIGDNKIPYMTLPDYCWRGDLKTKWSKVSKTTKTGWAQNSLPSKLSGMWEQANVSQVAGFRALNGGMPCWLLYVNKSDYRLFTQYNCDELTPDYLDDVIRETERQNAVTEKMLTLADSTSDLLDLVSPEWDDLCWQEPPGYLEEARKIWR